jgi:hypothetical protein
MSAHLLTVFASPAIPLLIQIGATPHPQAHAPLQQLLPALADPGLISVARYVGMISCTTMLFGLATRLSTIVTLAAFFLTQQYWFGTTVFHDDWLYFTFYLLVLCFAPIGDAFSFDAWRNRQPYRPLGAYRWPVEAIILWFAFNYFAAGIAKIFPLAKGAAWLSGASAREFAQEFVRDSPLFWVLGHSAFPLDADWPFFLASVLTAIVELGAICLLFTRRAYLPVLAALIGMHFGIWLMGIPGFVQIALVSAVAFASPSWFESLDLRWRERIRLAQTRGS